MKWYILSEEDFKAAFKILSEKQGSVLAIKQNKDKTRSVQQLAKPTQEEDTEKPERVAFRNSGAPRSKAKIDKYKKIRERLAEKRRKLDFSE